MATRMSSLGAFALQSMAAMSGLSGLVAAGINSTYTNPIIPGWHSDPSCTFVAELDNTFFCTTSSFLAFPGIPVFASKDLVNWKLASNALTRPSQLPQLLGNGQQQEGIWASTLRYRPTEGLFYLVTSYISYITWQPKVLLFTTRDPYADSWSDPLRLDNPGNDIDPDLFWDDDGKFYMSVAAGIHVTQIDLATGAALDTFKVWNGTGARNPEGPHFYKKDGFYYLLLGEGGTETNHSATIGRSRDIRGPYESCPYNPIMTAKGTGNYFQTVGHADLFEGGAGNWWATALATRSGPAWETYPMGRELVLAPATWGQGQWPVVDPIFGEMAGPLPVTNRHVPGDGPWTSDPDVVDFEAGSAMPRHFVHWRPPKKDMFVVSPSERPGSLKISPSRGNLTGDKYQDPPLDGLGFVGRRQTATLFEYSVDVEFAPSVLEEEAGVTLFLTQLQHVDLGIVNLAAGSGCRDKTGNATTASFSPHLRFRAEASGNPNGTVPVQAMKAVPAAWLRGKIRLSVSTSSNTTYVMSAASAADPNNDIVMVTVQGSFLSGGDGPFSGTLIGAYATRNGGTGKTPAYFSRWRYTPTAQQVDLDLLIPL